MTEAPDQFEAPARRSLGAGGDVEEAEEVVKALLLGGGEGAPGKSRQILEDPFADPNCEIPFTALMYLVKIDEEATGNGYIEVTRNNAGEIDGLYHAPSHTIRILKGGRGFVQIRGSLERYFKHFGDERALDATTGKEAAGSRPTRST